MVEERPGTTPKALWILLIVGPVLTALAHEINFVLVRHACSAQRTVALYGVMLLAIVLTVGSVIVGHRIWRRERVSWPGEDHDLATRITFIAILGMLASVISLHIMIAQFIAIMVFDPCQL